MFADIAAALVSIGAKRRVNRRNDDMIWKIAGLAAAMGASLLPQTNAVLAQEYGARVDRPAVVLSNRERRVAYSVRLPDGRVVRRAGGGGIPWLYGLGDVYGKASAVPLVDGSTPSVLASTPSGGVVPGQEPR
ncbi:hypothetical protein [Jiella avicenniae]|uniref:Uncharacterized protein n=1 Tax=Jiella avicenniae TaxID=2907202 RepID=A0A9X1P018_9HYPH|nr:hypothetical protein [Jiella avicenniae]MCE7027389.1 hypothetical protein [Jiella avicenniae]